MTAYGLEDWWADFANDGHRASWYGVLGSDAAVCITRGVRPGDPLADVDFCSVFTLYVKELEPRLAQIGISISLPEPARCVLRDRLRLRHH